MCVFVCTLWYVSVCFYVICPEVVSVCVHACVCVCERERVFACVLSVV